MQKKHYWLALIAVASLWIFAVGRSASELFGLVRTESAPPPAATLEAPSEALVARSPERRDEERAPDAPAVAAVERAPVPASTPVASRVTELPPPVYADAEYASDVDGAEPIDHPEVTDPRLRKLLQPAWDD